MQQLQGRVAVVTGAASGIGLAMAQRFATAGMKLVLADIEAAALQRALAQLQVTGATAMAVPALLQPNSLANWQWTMGVNLMGVVHGLRAFVPRMLDGGDAGHVINSASVAGLLTGSGPYFASKHAVTCVSEGLYEDFKAMGAKLSASVLCPGVIRTAILDAERDRPAQYGGPTDLSALSEQAKAWAASFRESVATGIDPAVVADAVAEAVVHDRFYIVSAQVEFHERIATRMADLCALRNPTLTEARR